MTQCPICGQTISETATRCESCEQWAAAVVAPSVPAPPVATAPAPLPRRSLAWVPAVVIASGAITFGALSSRSASPAADRPGAASAPRSTVAKAAAAADGAPRQRWTSEHRARWLADARGSVAFELPAEDAVPVWMRRVRPALVVRCTAGRIDAFVFTDSALAIEAQTEDHTATFSIDGAAPRTERWADSENHDALFAPDGAAFVRRLLDARTLEFGYTPHNAAPVTARFSVDGLDALVGSSAKACGLSSAGATR